jgi:Nucleotidyltransferase
VDDFAPFARLLEALRPWLDHLVIVGGWAHRLYRFDRLAHSPEYRPLTTKDADLAFAPNAPLAGDIAAALKAAGFDQEFSGDDAPPVTEYKLGGEEQGFFAEFLTPLYGDGLERDGSDDVTFKRAGITAQKLRYVELLLTLPWSVQLSPEVGVPVQQSVAVRIANPVSFIAQKLLIHGRRKPDKRVQDALYIHDTLELFSRELGALRAIWEKEVSPGLPRKTAKAIDRLRRQQFAAVTDVHRAAVRIPQDRALTPDRLQAACAYGLNEVFGSTSV